MEPIAKEILKVIGFEDAVDHIECGFCPSCSKPIVMAEFRDALSKKEFSMSGLCQACQDEVFG